MSVVLSMPSKSDIGKQAKQSLVSSIFMHVKSKAEFMSNSTIARLVTAAAYLKINDKKFCKAVTAVVCRRARGVGKETLARLLFIDSRLDGQSLKEMKPEILGIIGHIIDKKELRLYSMADALIMIRAVKGLDARGMFLGSKVLKDHLLSDLLTGAKQKFTDLVKEDHTHTKRYKQAVSKIQEIMQEFEGVTGNEEFNKIFKEFLINFPGGAKSIDLTLKRCEYLLDALESEGHLQTKGVRDFKASFDQSSAKNQIIGLHNKLNQIAKRCNGLQLVSLFKLMARMQDSHDLPISSIVKKLAVYRLVSDSFMFSPDDLLVHSQYYSKYVSNYDALILKIVDQLSFDEYSQLTQMEFQFRKMMSQRYQSELDWPGEMDIRAGHFKNFAEVEQSEVASKPLFKFNTLFCNSALLLSATSKRDFLTSVDMKPPSSLHMTRESIDVIDRVKHSLTSNIDR